MAVACQSTAIPPIVFVGADLVMGINRKPLASSPGLDSAGNTSEKHWATLVFRVLIRNDGETPIKNPETRLVASAPMRDLYGGADPFAAESGTRNNYGDLGLQLAPGNTFEVRRSINVVALTSDAEREYKELSPSEIARLIEVKNVADQTTFEISWEGGSQRFELSGQLEPEDWPPFTMVYELEQGQIARVGDKKVDSRQTRRLEYESFSKWKETVIESAPIETRVGTFSAVGSYIQLDGRNMVEYNAQTEFTHREEIEDGARYYPKGISLPNLHLQFEEIDGITPIDVKIGSLVCFRDDCEKDEVGRLYRLESGREWVFANDSRGFPLKIGSRFLVRELWVDDSRR